VIQSKAVCEAVGVGLGTVRKWVIRHEEEGLAGLRDRSSRPQAAPVGAPEILGGGIAGCVVVDLNK
jgi:transposase